MRAWRAALLGFDAADRPWRIDDGLLVVDDGRIVDLGEFAEVAPRHSGVDATDWRGLTLAPGFVDTHVHYAQLDLIGSPADGLLAWLARHTFPLEARFEDPAHCAETAAFFLDELLRNGVTTAMVWASSHPQSVDAFLAESRRRGLRMIAGQVLMDRDAPAALCHDTERSLAETEALIGRWHATGRLGCAITPRFVPSCSARQLAGAAELARAHPDVWVQTHAAENLDEVASVRRLYPSARSYLDVYAAAGLMRPRSVFAHCIHIDDEDRALLVDRGAAIAVCPTSNLFLGSGLFDFAAAAAAAVPWGFGSDVGAGSSLSPMRTMLTAFEVARLRGFTLDAGELWARHTVKAARAIDLGGFVGNLAVGLEADFIALDAAATPLLARRTASAATLDDWLFAMIVLADDRAVRQCVVGGEVVSARCRPRRRSRRR